MVEKETRIIATVTDSISHWRRYVDNTFVFIKKGCVEHALARLNSFQKNIQFIYELENHLVRSLRKDMHGTLPENVQTKIYYTATKLGTKYDNIKDPVKKSHQHDAVFNVTCPGPDCVEDDTGETGRRLNKRIIVHNGRDKNSHLNKRSQESNHRCVALNVFKIIDCNFQNQKFKKKNC